MVAVVAAAAVVAVAVSALELVVVLAAAIAVAVAKHTSTSRSHDVVGGKVVGEGWGVAAGNRVCGVAAQASPPGTRGRICGGMSRGTRGEA